MKFWICAVFCLLFGISRGSDAEGTAGTGSGTGTVGTVGNSLCLNTIHEACLTNSPGVYLKVVGEMTRNASICSSTFGGFPQIGDKIQQLVSKHLQASMQYLLIGNHYNEWEIDRKGFHKFFLKLSDDTFQDGIMLIQQLTKRGGSLANFTVPMPENEIYQLSELEGMSKALDIEKTLASRKLNLAHAATHGDIKVDQHADGELAHFLNSDVSDKNSHRVKALANHVNTLTQVLTHSMTKNTDTSFVLHLYDTQFMNLI